MSSPIFKCVIYVLIAALTSLSAELSNIHNFSEVSSIKIVAIVTGIVLQSLIAMRAFLDQSISKESSVATEDSSIK